MEKIWKALKDWWEVAIAFGGAILSAYDIASQLQTYGGFKPDVVFAIGLLLFLTFGSIAILKTLKKGRDVRISSTPAEQNIGVQSKNQSGGVTAHTINIQSELPQRDEKITRNIDLTIIPQEKVLDDTPYIIISVTNNENRAFFCKVEIRGIYNESNENIKREISQYANLFSWSGGSQNGIKEILAGLDGTVNLVIRRTNAHGIYFLFHENPNSNWKKPGIYKLDLVVRGAVGEIEFIGKKVLIDFEYIEKEERDSMGGSFNKGILKLLDWHVENDMQ